MSASSSSSGGRLSAEMRNGRRISPMSPTTSYAMNAFGTSPDATSQMLKDDPRIKEMCLVIAKLITAQSEVTGNKALHEAYAHVIENHVKLLNERYKVMKHMSPHSTTEVTRVTRHSDGTVERDHEVFQDGREVEHDHYRSPSERLSRSRSPTRRTATEVTRVTRRSDGTVERDHEVFQDGKEIEHDHESSSPLLRSPPRSRPPFVSPRRVSPGVVSPRVVSPPTL